MRHRRTARAALVAVAVLAGALATPVAAHAGAVPTTAAVAARSGYHAAAPERAPALPATGTLGGLTLRPDHGSVTDTPMLSATTSAPCPSGYGTDATLRLGRGDAFNNLNKPQTAGGYDKAPFTIAANRSMTTSALATPADGAYQVIVICTGELLGDNPAVFQATVTVHGATWSLAAPAAADATATPSAGASASAATDPIAAVTGAASPAALAPPGQRGHGPLVWLPVGISLLIAVIAVLSYLSHRRHQRPEPTPATPVTRRRRPRQPGNGRQSGRPDSAAPDSAAAGSGARPAKASRR